MKQLLTARYIGILLGILLTSCATIIKTPRQDIYIVSQPDKAKIVIYDSNNLMVWNGETPSNINLNKGNGYFKGAAYKLEISKPGFQTMTLQLKPSTSGWYIGGNFLVGGLIGWLVVDPITEAMWILNPKNLNIQLSKYDNQAEGLKVVMLNEIDKEVLNENSAQRIN